MTTAEGTSPRLLFRVNPLPFESPRGYLCRVAADHGYDSPAWLTTLAGFSGSEAALDREDRVHRLAHLLRLEPEEWLAMCYRHVNGGGHLRRILCGKPVSTNELNIGKPRVCPACLQEDSIWWAVWDLCLVAACPFIVAFSLTTARLAKSCWPGSVHPCMNADAVSIYVLFYPKRRMPTWWRLTPLSTGRPDSRLALRRKGR
jgi:hypothetical protein